MVKKNSKYINKVKKSRKIEFLKIIYILILFAIIAFCAYQIYNYNPKQVIVKWDIDKAIPKNEDYYVSVISEQITNKYLINIDKIKQKLEKQPWVKEIKITRTYWNKINIKLIPHNIAMRWQDAGYISDTGVLLKTDVIIKSPKPLAIVNEDEVLEFFKSYQSYKKAISPLIITEFKRDKIDTIKVNTGVLVVLGMQNQQQRIKTFLQAYDKLKKQSNRIKTQSIFDMRYIKGFALSYQE